MDEFERIAYLRRRFAPRAELRGAFVLGIGDDAGVEVLLALDLDL